MPLFEAVMNSIQATQDAGNPKTKKILVEIEREGDLLNSIDAQISSFKISDNGIGFDDTNFNSFNTSFSDHRSKSGGKGVGRFLWLRAFDQAQIDSTFFDSKSQQTLQRTFLFDIDYDPEKVPAPINTKGRNIATTIHLKGFQNPFKQECPKEFEHLANRLIEHFIVLLLRADCPLIELKDGAKSVNLNELFKKEYAANASAQNFEIKGKQFQLLGFKLIEPRSYRHRIIYAAAGRGVKTENLDKYVASLKGRLETIDGKNFSYLGVIQSDFLDEKVNDARTAFDASIEIESDADQIGFFEEDVRLSEIRERSLQLVQQDLKDSLFSLNEAKEQKIRQYVKDEAPQYKVLLKHIRQFIDKLDNNPSRNELETLLHREFHERELELKREGKKIIAEAAKLQNYEEYRDRLVKFMNDYNELGVSTLAQYVIHRRVILDFLKRAISIEQDTQKFPIEEVIHNVVFPMRNTDEDITYSEQNLWIIDDRFSFFTFVASDKPLRSIGRIESSSKKRPDLFMFDRKVAFSDGGTPVNSIVVVEFKKPQRDDYTRANNPLGQVFDVIQDIRSGKFKDERGRPIPTANEKIPAYAFIICDITSSLKDVLDDRDAHVTPDGHGYFGFHQKFGIYFEIIDYDKLIRDAEKRNHVLFEKLNLISEK